MPFFCSCVSSCFLVGATTVFKKAYVLPSLLLTFVVYGGRLSFIGVGVLDSLWGWYVVVGLEVPHHGSSPAAKRGGEWGGNCLYILYITSFTP
ncbi:hypothetical protein K440DRAFT_619944 [Wilcoxina mikolae CBS 423.85]|nr:hypothetical protein K440DRAFT_619944 [Wilcoxina mikolae CBS 423.85]